MCGLLAETQKKVAWYCNCISWGKKSIFAVAIMWYDVGTCTRLLCINRWGLVAPLSLSSIKRDASRFGDVKQIWFAEASCREGISPLMGCWGPFPFQVSQLSPNTHCIVLQIPCWPCSAEAVQSLSLGTERLKKVSASYPMYINQNVLHGANKCFTHSMLQNAFLKKKKKKNSRKSRIIHVTQVPVIE